jgi:hypothetical protein
MFSRQYKKTGSKKVLKGYIKKLFDIKNKCLKIKEKS